MLPAGTVTFLFTDVEGSTTALERHGAAMGDALARHHALIGAAVDEHGGVVFETVGDAVYAAFGRAADAMAAALDAQRALRGESWGTLPSIRVRAGVHTGDVELRGDHYFGAALFRCARIQALAHGGQTLVSGVTARLVAGALPDDARLADLGTHRLKDLGEPEHIFQLADPGVPDTFPGLRSLDAQPHNLPLQLTAFVGRQQDLARVGALVREHRLVTLTGPGGTGKTRLALQIAADAIDAHREGAFFIDLGDLSDPGLVVEEVAGTLGVRAASGVDTERALFEHLARRSLLLVLDNFEQVLEAAPIVTRLLAAAPRVRVLVTSRVPLHVRGEQEYAVSPLPVPAAGSRPTAASLSQYDSVTLFIDRAVRVDPGFEMTDESAPAVAEICSRLDGLPLAIELAAARMKVLSPDELLRRLGHSLPLLTGGGRDVPDRQRTLRATIAWSHDLLDPSEQLLFARLAVFAGGFTLEAAEAVCGEDGVHVLDGVSSLLDKSLVGARETGSGTRYAMLETIREYGIERLEASTEADAIRRRHAEHFLALAEAWHPVLQTGQASDGMRRLEADHENLRSMLTWAESRGEDDLIVHACGALGRFWSLTGHFADMDTWIEHAASKASGGTAVQATILHNLALVRLHAGAIDESLEIYREVLELRRAFGDRAAEGYVLNNIGTIEHAHGHPEAAREAYEASIAALQSLPGVDPGTPMINLSGVLFARGDTAAAADLLEQVIGIQRGIPAVLPGFVHVQRAFLALAEGDLPRMIEAYDEACRLAGRIDNPMKTAAYTTLEGHVRMAQGHPDEAKAAVRAGFRIIAGLGSPDHTTDHLEVAAIVALHDDRPTVATKLLGCAASLRERMVIRRFDFLEPVIRRASDAARAALGQAAFEQAFDEGRTMDLAAAERLFDDTRVPAS